MDVYGYMELKKKWRVSITAMMIRAYKLGAINQNQYLMKKMSARGYRTKDPLDNIPHRKKPILFQQAIDLVLTKKELSPAALLKKFALFNTKAEAILGLKLGKAWRYI